MTRIRSITTAGPLTTYECKSYARTYTGFCTTSPTYVDTETNISVGTGPVSEKTVITMEDIVTPNFKAKVARGEIINSPMTKTTTYIYEPECSLNIGFDCLSYCSNLGSKRLDARMLTKGKAPFSTASKPSTAKYLNIKPFSDAEISACQDRASAKAYSNIDHSDVLLLATIAEADKTVVGITQLLRKVHSIFRKLRRRQYKKLAKEISRAAYLIDLYMQARYELRPLYYDILGIANAMQRVAPAVGSRETFRGYDYIEKSVKRDFPFNQTYGSALNLTCPCITRSETTHRVECRAGVLTQFMGMPSGQAYGIYSIPETIWELIPFSFIVDWFCNVGTVVSAWAPNVESKVLASWVVTTSVITKTARVIPSAPVYAAVGATASECVNAFCKIDALHMQVTEVKKRVPFAKRYTLPHFDVKLDPLKTIDLGIIIRNLFKSGSQIKNIR